VGMRANTLQRVQYCPHETLFLGELASTGKWVTAVSFFQIFAAPHFLCSGNFATTQKISPLRIIFATPNFYRKPHDIRMKPDIALLNLLNEVNLL
jgi:hypothetical protein